MKLSLKELKRMIKEQISEETKEMPKDQIVKELASMDKQLEKEMDSVRAKLSKELYSKLLPYVGTTVFLGKHPQKLWNTCVIEKVIVKQIQGDIHIGLLGRTKHNKIIEITPYDQI